MKQLCGVTWHSFEAAEAGVAESYRSSHFSTLTLGSHADFGRQVFSLSVCSAKCSPGRQSHLPEVPRPGSLVRQWLTWPGQLRGGFWPGQHILLTRVCIVCAWPRGGPWGPPPPAGMSSGCPSQAPVPEKYQERVLLLSFPHPRTAEVAPGSGA